MRTTYSLLRMLPLALASALTAAGCVTHNSTGTNVGRSEAGQVQTVQQGVVQSVRVVTIQPDGRNVGGAVAGAAVGNAVGGPVATVGGAAAGSAIQGSAGTRQGLEVTVLLDNGQTVAIAQESALDAFRPGDKVNVTTSGNTTRVSRR
jgi:outer membrane lipoprotein SlyB